MKRYLTTLAFFGSVGFICSLAGALCYDRAIGLYPIVDILSNIGLPVGFFISCIVLILLVCAFLYYLVTLKFAKALKSIAICIIPLFAIALVMPAMGRVSPKQIKFGCGVRMRKVGEALKQYAQDHNDVLPEKEWCDILIMECDFEPLHLLCSGYHTMYFEGESSYCLNRDIIKSKFSQLPADTVILFETDYGKKNHEELIPVGQRKYTQEIGGSGDTKQVRKGAWNQVGDISIISYDHHAGLGCNILFADGHVEFIKKKDVLKLRWKP